MLYRCVGKICYLSGYNIFKIVYITIRYPFHIYNIYLSCCRPEYSYLLLRTMGDLCMLNNIF